MVTRRDSLRATAAAVGGVSLTSLSGCIGGITGGGGGTQEVHVVTTPIEEDSQSIVNWYVYENTTLIEDKLSDAGYDFKVTYSFDAPSLLASGEADIVTGMSSLEAGIMGVEREIDLAVIGTWASLINAMYVKSGGEYSTEQTGSVEATIDKLADDNAKIGIPSWGSGSAPGMSLIMDEGFGYEFSQDRSDFRIVSLDYGPVPSLTNNGEVKAGMSTPGRGKFPELTAQGELEVLFWLSDKAIELGLGEPTLNDAITRQSFLEENPDAVDATIEAWQEGVDWLLEAPLERASDQTVLDGLADGTSTERVEYLLRVYLPGIETEQGHDPVAPGQYESVTLSSDQIEGHTTYLNNVAAGTSLITEAWADYVEFPNLQ